MAALLGLMPVVALAGAVALARLWPRPLTRAVLAAVLVLAALAALAWLAVAADFRGAAGFVDCSPDCTPLQLAVGATIFYGPGLMALAVLVGAAYVSLTSHRGAG